MQEPDACNNGACLGVLPQRKEESMNSMPSFGKPPVALNNNQKVFSDKAENANKVEVKIPTGLNASLPQVEDPNEEAKPLAPTQQPAMRRPRETTEELVASLTGPDS